VCGVCNIDLHFWNYIFNWHGWNSTDWWDEGVENFLSFNSIVKGSKMNKVSHLFLLSTYWYLVKKHCMQRIIKLIFVVKVNIKRTMKNKNRKGNRLKQPQSKYMIISYIFFPLKRHKY
jgi:hypothetical protein